MTVPPTSAGASEMIAALLTHVHVLERQLAAAEKALRDTIGDLATRRDELASAKAELQSPPREVAGAHAASVTASSEERLSLFIDSATDYAMFTTTIDGRIDSWNAGAERMFGYTAAEAIGAPHAMMFTSEDRAAGVPQQEARAASGQRGRARNERWHVRKNGSRVYCSGVVTGFGGAPPIGLAMVARDLTASHEAADTLAGVRTELESQSRRLIAAQDDQRARLARDLHDHFGQQLTALRLTLERHQQASTDARARDEMTRALALTGGIDDAIRLLGSQLRPATLDDLGLAVALPRYVKKWAEQVGSATEFRFTRLGRGRLNPEAETAFFRVAQEALNNVAKHAHASHVDVILEQRDGIVALLIEDDGIGFDLADPGIRAAGAGIAGMRERAALVDATIEVESAPGHGTTVYLRTRAGEP